MRIASLDIGGTKIAGALVEITSLDEMPSISCRKHIPTDAKKGGDTVLGRITELLGEIKNETGGFDAIAVGTAGTVSAKDGSIAFASDIMPGWMGQPVGKHLTDVFGVDSFVINDVNAHALGETYFGAAKGQTDMLMIAAGTGVSGAVIANGHVIIGANGYAGAFELTEQIMFTYDGIDFANTINIEQIASGTGIELQYRLGRGEELTGAEISKRAHEGDEFCKHIIEQAGLGLGQCIGNWANIFDPGIIVIGGSLLKSGAMFSDKLHEGFQQSASVLERNTQIVEAKLKDDAPILGAAVYAFQRLEPCE